MKKLIVLIIAIIVTLTGCTASDSEKLPQDGKLNIVTTIFPPYDFVRQIGGDKVNVHLLIPPGSESHTYEPSPGDIIKIQQCDMFIYTGGSGDVWAENIIDSIDSNTLFVSMMDIVAPLTEQYTDGMQIIEHQHHTHDEGGNHSHEDDAEYDEHVWTSPVNADIICKYICEQLCMLDSSNSEYYKSNYSDYSIDLKQLDADVRSTINNAKRHTIIYADRFPIRYFTEEYGIEYYAAFPGCAAEVEPSPSTLMFLIDKVHNENVPVVFYREFSNKKVAQIICEDTNAKMLLFHSCHNVTKEEFENGITYIDLMKQNIANLKEALN